MLKTKRSMIIKQLKKLSQVYLTLDSVYSNLKEAPPTDAFIYRATSNLPSLLDRVHSITRCLEYQQQLVEDHLETISSTARKRKLELRAPGVQETLEEIKARGPISKKSKSKLTTENPYLQSLKAISERGADIVEAWMPTRTCPSQVETLKALSQFIGAKQELERQEQFMSQAKTSSPLCDQVETLTGSTDTNQQPTTHSSLTTSMEASPSASCFSSWIDIPCGSLSREDLLDLYASSSSLLQTNLGRSGTTGANGEQMLSQLSDDE